MLRLKYSRRKRIVEGMKPRGLENLEDRRLLAASIKNLPVTNLGPTEATIGVEVVDIGGSTLNLSLYWGRTDGGTTTGQWENRIRIGDGGVGTYHSLNN